MARRPFRSGQSQIECVSSISRDGRPTRCGAVLTRRQPSASAKRWPVRMRPIRRIHPGGSTRLRNSVSRWKARVGSLVLAVANTPRRQKGCAGACRSPAQTSFCELTSHLFPLFRGAFARLSAVARVGLLLYSRLEHCLACIAEFGILLSETNRYLICIGDECTAKSEHVWGARQALFQCSL